MAEQHNSGNAEASQGHKPIKWFTRIRNYWVTLLIDLGISHKVQEKTGYEPEYRLYEGQNPLSAQPALRLKEKNFLNIFQNRSSSVVKVEMEWDKVKEVMKKIEILYMQSMIYLEPHVAEYEYGIYQNGVSKDFDKNQIAIRGKTFEYNLPKKAKLRHTIPGMKNDLIFEVSPFGYNRAGEYVEHYQNVVEEICNYVGEIEKAKVNDNMRKDNIEKNITLIKDQHRASIARIIQKYCGDDTGSGIEASQYSLAGSAKKASDQINQTFKGIAQLRLRKESNRRQFIFYNNFQIVRNKVWGEKSENAVLKKALIDSREFDTKLRELREQFGQQVEGYRWEVRGDEAGPGLDEFGYPLEVDSDGKVMIDKFDKKTGKRIRENVRSVPNDFIKDLDALETAIYEEVFFDTYRDDLRDGRYHHKSTTITDIMQANNSSLWNLWKLGHEDHVHTSIKGRTVTGQKERIIKLNGPYKGKKMKYKIRPTDKNPAFDFRALNRGKGVNWRHAGRRYYYDVPDGTMTGSMLDAHISSRGISMYIIEKITREMEEFHDITKILDGIGRQGGQGSGYDYGTRPWSLWGNSMISDIYNWTPKMDDVNEPAKGEDLDEFKSKIESFFQKG